MKYFGTLPKVIKTNPRGESVVLTNLMARASVISSLMDNPLVYYTYDIQESDTPESIAYKYYGDVYRYWIVMFANKIIDPQWNWPMNYKTFQSYLEDKYPSTNIYGTVHGYYKTVQTTDSETSQVTTNTVQISEEQYNTLVESTNSYTLPTGEVTVSITKSTKSIYEYELEQNESRRTIKLIKSSYAGELEKQLKDLMNG